MCKTSATSSKWDNNNRGMKNNKNFDGNIEPAKEYPVQPMEPTETTVSTCCGCRPKAKRKSRKYKKEPEIDGWRRVFHLRARFRDVDPGKDSEWTAFHHHHGSESGRSSVKSDDDDDSMFFFDAVDHPLGEDEYPIDGYIIGGRGKPRVVFTTSMEHPAPRVSLEEPVSMLRNSLKNGPCSSTGSRVSWRDAHEDDSLELVPQENTNYSNRTKAKIANHKEPSLRFKRIRSRSTEELTTDLQQFPTPPAVEDVIGMAGYPGTLTVEELEECQKFLRGLNELPPAVAEQVYSLRDIEDQPYTICRWLRATKFDADAILTRLAENQFLFEQAKAHNFYGPDIEDHLGCPLSVFLSQYPFLSVGRGRNGSPINYFLAGKINPEGIMALCTIEQLTCYFWFSFMYKMKDEMRITQQMNEDFCRCEGINVLDLSGLSASALTSETMEVIKIASKVSDFFPETLHAMLVINAPGFFAFSWKLIKNFIDPRTASRIQLFSSQVKGQKALESLVDKKKEMSSDYGGGNISLQEAFLRECSDPQIVRQEIELIHCKRKSKKAISKAWRLSENECMEITIYTRSVSQAEVSISLDGSIVKIVRVQCKFEGEGVEMKPLPNKTTAVYAKFGELVGPGKVVVEAHDIDSTISRHHGSMSRGYYLVVGDIKPVASVSQMKGKPRVSFSFDNEERTKSNQRDFVTVPPGATITMTGVDDPKSLKRKSQRKKASR
eukprot:CAMPEP_0168202500 /NCGR_PEP_ID=MMETSP0139_2-20121125/24308_1 /TAXON_ID=44445 /ORGANISM="Pseudo-nitzschia australis, Strain 10249 10 AB" /LENGTH=719 /DNA_ID=CAMNT_0008128197 /DNA_START=164 /DNA_END=2323 /DNA_ORIENTATION=-